MRDVQTWNLPLQRKTSAFMDPKAQDSGNIRIDLEAKEAREKRAEHGGVPEGVGGHVDALS